MKRSKYNTAQKKKDKPNIDGYVFDSKDEAEYYLVLKDWQDEGHIKCLRVHPVFELQPKFKKNGVSHRSIKYEADFSYFSVHDIECDGEIVVDVKGVATETAKLKRKMFEFTHPKKELDWVSYTKKTGFIAYDELKKNRKANKKKC